MNRKKKKKAKIVIDWKKFVPAVTMLAAVLFVFGYLLHIAFRPKTPKAAKEPETPKVVEVPDELKTANQDYDSIIEQDGKALIAAYYPKNVDQQIVQRIQQEVRTFKETPSEEERQLYIDYSYEDHANFRVCRFTKKSGPPEALAEEQLLEARLMPSGKVLTLDTLFEGPYKQQISARMRKRLWKENRHRPSFYENTDPESEAFQNCTIGEEGLTFTFDKAKLYQDESGTCEEQISYQEMAHYLREPLPKVPKSEDDPGHVHYVDIHKPMVALTFDDGPYDKVTAKILDLLEKHDAVATFFVVGSRVGSDYDHGCVERAVRMGCDIGNHTYSHKYELPDLSVSDMMGELGNCEDAVKAVAPDYQMRFMRPTAGAIDDRVKENAPYAIITWSLDTLDWSSRDSDQIYAQVTDTIQDGDIILMHDLYEETYGAVARLVPDLSDQFQFVSVSELIEYKGDDIEIGRVYKHEHE